MTETKPERRWFNFSLRTLFVLVTVLCIWLGFLVNAARRNKEAIDSVLSLHGAVDYTYQFPNGLRDDHAEPPGPAWLRRLCGEGYFVRALGLQFWKQPISDDDLAEVGILTDLIRLSIVGGGPGDAKITGPGLVHLRNLTKLRWLDLHQCPITDDSLRLLDTLTELQSIDLRGTQITGEGLKYLKPFKNLANVDFDDAPVTDVGLRFLEELPSLKRVSLRNTKVTADGIRKLQEIMPNLKIQY